MQFSHTTRSLLTDLLAVKKHQKLTRLLIQITYDRVSTIIDIHGKYLQKKPSDKAIKDAAKKAVKEGWEHIKQQARKNGKGFTSADYGEIIEDITRLANQNPDPRNIDALNRSRACEQLIASLPGIALKILNIVVVTQVNKDIILQHRIIAE